MTNQTKLTAKQYFSAVLLLTLAGLVLLVVNNAELKQLVKESIGLSAKLQAADHSFYNERVQAVFDKYCIGCHDDNKAKGHLRLDSFRQTSFGGRTGNILMDGENSILLERMLLPEQDRLAMPPYGRDRQTADEIEVLRQWLKQGASGELTASHFPHAPEKVRDITFAETDMHAIELAREPLLAAVQNLQHQYPTSLSYTARTSADLFLSGLILKVQLTDSVLADFAPVFSAITHLDLRHTAITDKGLANISKMKNLISLNLVGANISSVGLNQLINLAVLQNVVLDKNMITPQQIALFKSVGTKLVIVEKSL
ncbi:c-type cytochrome domain-containing protein [Paraglaciecola sp. L3A3]|uniref:c-type cytochrome domain-containing protein n=1 Tax=Paraglaciecola sp. L3A3 TaxID=2686358 RepID=UPI00131D1A42|nr:c-type cytochrome domain-containing protein [Paraglaciecola sp. L3A3]